ncbi:MAG: GDP-fucose protein O-fucosyltransferase-domain-containing protein [Linnemannia gamsii]|nr:MAG: GDP-fucose protein O-fucosyltransferase-domain-containing protein [Linnemannia gamsii]
MSHFFLFFSHFLSFSLTFSLFISFFSFILPLPLFASCPLLLSLFFTFPSPKRPFLLPLPFYHFTDPYYLNMSPRHTDHSSSSDDDQSPIYQAHPPAYQAHTFTHSHTFPIPHSHSITINPATTLLSSPALLSPSPRSSSPTSPSSSSSKKKSLQVSWHPSVNQRQSEKRNRRTALLLAVLLFFSSVTLLLVHFSGCDIATGHCQQLRQSELSSSSSASSNNNINASHGRKRLPTLNTGSGFGGEAWMMDQDGLVAGPAGRSASRYGRPAPPLSSWKTGDKSSQDLAGSDTIADQHEQEDDYMDSAEVGVGNNNNRGGEDSDAEDYFEDDEYEIDGGSSEDEEEGSDENSQDEDDYLLGRTPGATPQEAYIDIWNEGSDMLSEDDFLELEEDYHTVTKTSGSQQQQQQKQQQQQQSLARSLDPNTNYMTYLPYAGLTNQFYGMLRAIMVAKSLGRTLILPPITASSHDKSKQNQPWSDYFDIDAFMQLTGADVIELKDLRQADKVSAIESLTCHITCGFGSLRPLDFTAKEFLRQWKFDLSMTQLEIETTEFNELVPALRSQESEQMLCITNGYKIAVPKKEEWDLYGRYFYFTPAVEQFFTMALEKLSSRNHLHQQHRFYDSDFQDRNYQQQQQQPTGSGDNNESGQGLQQLNDFDQRVDTNDLPYDRVNSALSTNTRHYNNVNNNNNNNNNNNIAVTPSSLHGPFISIHARRGDFIDYCQQQFPHALSSCLPTTQELASTLNDLLVSDPSLRGLPVYVSTNEDRSDELADFKAMGWQVLEDSFLGASERLGVFGPMMMDQVFMSQAQTLIGVRTSTFSRVGAYRQEDWYGRRAVLM